MRKTVLSFLGAVLISMPVLAQSVKLNSKTSPTSGQAGVTTVSVTGSGFPAGTISPANVKISLKPSSGTTVTTTASSVTVGSGTTRTIAFLIPASINVSSPTTYTVTVSGNTDGGTAFSTSSAASLTVNPAASIHSLSPTSGTQGQSLSVTITGSFTHFASGVTTANFGPGISVGGAAEGGSGPVTVGSATSAVASLVIDPVATIGSNNVSVATGSEAESLAGGFKINPVTVKLNSSASPSSGQSGVTAETVSGSGFPTGTITSSNVTVTLTPSGGGAVTTTAASVSPSTGGTRTIGFVIPTIPITASTVYAVSVAGEAENGTPFTSSNSSSLTVTPPATISSITPSSGTQGQSLSVTIVGLHTNFVSGKTVANLGPGIAVGGAAAGSNGPVTVTNSTTAVAKIVISSSATAGGRTVTITTGSQVATQPSGFTVTSVNRPPTAAPGGPYSVRIPGAVQFNGSGSSDPNNGGSITAYDWNFGDGTAHGSGVTPTHTYTSPGTYNGTLVVTDNLGLSSSPAAYVVTVSPAIPVAVPGGPYSVTRPSAVLLNGSGSFDPDPNATIVSYTWNFGDGSANGTGSSVSHTYAAPGTYNGTLTVTDSRGTSSAATAFVVTVAAATPIAAPGGPYAVTRPSAVQLNGSGSSDPDPNATISTYTWNFGDSSPNGTGATVSHTYATPGNYNGTLTVTDNFGTSSTAAGFVVTVTAATPIAAPGGPYAVTRPSGVQLDGSGSSDPDPSATITTYTWNFGDGSTNGTGSSVSHTYATSGTYNGTLTVTDSFGTSSTATGFVVTVAAATPVAVPGGPYAVTRPSAVQLNGSASSDPDPSATISTYTWNFGDGSPNGTGSSVSHTYATPGTYNGTLTVADNIGTPSIAATFVVTVTAATPVAAPGGPYSVQASMPLQLDGTGSSDPDLSATLTYNWDFGDGSTHGTGATPSHTYISAGTYNGSLTVTDNFGNPSAPVSFAVTVTPANPVAVPGGPYSVQEPAAVPFDGSGSSDPNQNTTLTYDWNFGDGTPDGTGATPSHTYATAGTYNGTLTVTDSLGLSSSAVAFTVTVAPPLPPPQVAITSPEPLSVFNASGNPITVTGTIDKSNDTVTVNGFPAAVTGGTFTVSGIQLREGPNLITVVATDSAGNVGTTSETVTLNTTPPQLGILAPSDGAVLAASTVTVAGNVNEQVPGTINAKQVTVMVNGIAAVVSNRTFSATNVPLVQGTNTITVVATDPAGNSSQSTIHVTYMGTIPVQKILKVSGESQTGAIGTTLAQPLVIEAVDSNGAPVPGQTVTFSVVKSDGMLTSTTQQGQQVTAVTDQNGQASVQFALGSRVGVGNNQVSVTAPGYVGQALFCETSTVGAPAKILVEMGDAQTGLAGQALPSPLVVEVFDAGGNPVSYVPVTFNVEQGGGSFNGNPTLQVSTDINGMATALLVLGQQEGTNNNVISATFTNNPGPAASFVASAQAAGPASITSISGLVEDDSNTPVPGATITLEGTDLTATSDANGNFLISPAPVGTYLLKVDGHTSTRTDAVFPTLVYTITTIAGLNNTLGMPVCLPPLDPTSVQTYDPNSNQSVTLQMTGVPGYTFTVHPHSVFNPDGTPYSGPLSLSQVHADRVPMAPPHGTLPLIAGTLQPPGLHFNPPVATQFPNTSALAPGTVVDVYSYDHDQMDWVSQGPARVSTDGSVIISDPGFGISKSGWHFPPPPPPPPKCASSCTDLNPCTTGQCVNGACVFKPVADGTACGDGTATGQCGTGGVCQGGSCNYSSSSTDGTSCTPENKCVINAKCSGGKCLGQPYDTSSEKEDLELKGEIGFPIAFVEKIDEALDEATNGNISLETSVEPEAKKKNCCSQETGPIDDGDREGSATGKLTAAIQGFPIGPAIPPFYKLVSLPFVPNTNVSLQIQLGAFIGADIGLEGQVGVEKNQCDSKDSCTFASVVISFDPKVYVKGAVLACTSIYQTKKQCVGGEVSGGIQVLFTGGVKYNKPCGSDTTGTMTVSAPTIFGQAKVSYLGFSGQVGFEYALTGIWPAYACSFPGGCAPQH